MSLSTDPDPAPHLINNLHILRLNFQSFTMGFRFDLLIFNIK